MNYNLISSILLFLTVSSVIFLAQICTLFVPVISQKKRYIVNNYNEEKDTGTHVVELKYFKGFVLVANVITLKSVTKKVYIRKNGEYILIYNKKNKYKK